MPNQKSALLVGAALFQTPHRLSAVAAEPCPNAWNEPRVAGKCAHRAKRNLAFLTCTAQTAVCRASARRFAVSRHLERKAACRIRSRQLAANRSSELIRTKTGPQRPLAKGEPSREIAHSRRVRDFREHRCRQRRSWRSWPSRRESSPSGSGSSCMTSPGARPVASLGGNHTDTGITVIVRMPWAPWIRTPSISAVADGPVMNTAYRAVKNPSC